MAFTGKPKWVFHNVDAASGEKLDNQSMLKKVVIMDYCYLNCFFLSLNKALLFSHFMMN